MAAELTQLRQDLEALKSCIADRKDARQNWLEKSMNTGVFDDQPATARKKLTTTWPAATDGPTGTPTPPAIKTVCH